MVKYFGERQISSRLQYWSQKVLICKFSGPTAAVSKVQSKEFAT